MSDKIVVTSGDPSGIGPQVCIFSFGLLPARLQKRLVFICEKSVIEFLASNSYKLPKEIEFISPGVLSAFNPGRTNERECAFSSLRALEIACDMIEGNSDFKGLVTGPVSKDRISDLGCAFSGHTEFLKKRFSAKWVEMLFCSPVVNVLLATRHVPLESVSGMLNQDRIFFLIKLLADFFASIQGRIAVCGLNPHAGENGRIGREDMEIILPAVNRAREIGIDAQGPIPADTLFVKENLLRYKAVLAMYHDQGLIPVKALAFDKAVNVTLGLPFARTSPCHGTAYSIAYKAGREINYMPMVSAIKKAFELVGD